MKLEALLLKALFSACLLVCVLTLGNMLTAKAPLPAVAGAQPAAIATAG